MHKGVAYDFVCHTQHPLFVAKVKETDVDITDANFVTADLVEMKKKSAQDLAKMMSQLGDFLYNWRNFQNGKTKDVPE